MQKYPIMCTAILSMAFAICVSSVDVSVLTGGTTQAVVQNASVGTGRAACAQHPQGGRQVAPSGRRHEEPTISTRGGRLEVRGGL